MVALARILVAQHHTLRKQDECEQGTDVGQAPISSTVANAAIPPTTTP